MLIVGCAFPSSFMGSFLLCLDKSHLVSSLPTYPPGFRFNLEPGGGGRGDTIGFFSLPPPFALTLLPPPSQNVPNPAWQSQGGRRRASTGLTLQEKLAFALGILLRSFSPLAHRP